MTFIDDTAVLKKSVKASSFLAMFLMQLGVAYKLIRFSLLLEGVKHATGIICSVGTFLACFIEYNIAAPVASTFLFEFMKSCQDLIDQEHKPVEKFEKICWTYEKMKSLMEFPLLCLFAMCQISLLMSFYLLWALEGKYISIFKAKYFKFTKREKIVRLGLIIFFPDELDILGNCSSLGLILFNCGIIHIFNQIYVLIGQLADAADKMALNSSTLRESNRSANQPTLKNYQKNLCSI